MSNDRFLSDAIGTLRSSFRIGARNLVVSGSSLACETYAGSALAGFIASEYQATSSTSSTPSLGINVTGDTHNRVELHPDGTLWTGSGSVAPTEQVNFATQSLLGSWSVGASLTLGNPLGIAYGGTDLATTPTNGQLLIGNGTNYTLAALTQGTGITITNGAGTITIAGNTGTVTSVALTMPGIFSVAGSPITTSGTLAVTLANENANLVFAGPSSGSAAVPTFRALVSADIPALAYVTSVALTMPGIFSVAGSPITSSGTLAVTLANENANLVFAGPASGGAAAPTFRSLVAADMPALAYVTSVALTMPGIFSVSGSPITSSGTLAVTLATEAANLVFAGPTSGAAAAPTFRSLINADTPGVYKILAQAVGTANVTISGPGATLDGYTMVSGDRILLTGQSTASQNGLWIFNGSSSALTRPVDYPSGSTTMAFRGVTVYVLNGTVNTATTWWMSSTAAITIDTTSQAWSQELWNVANGVKGVMGVTYGGTGVNGSSAANGSLLIGNGSGFSIATLTQGATGITITNGVGSITIAGLNMTGATSGAAGTAGDIPQPTAGQQNYFLPGSGAWRLLSATTTTNDIPTTLLFSAVAAPGSPAEGNFWNDSTQKCLTAYVDGVKQFDTRTLYIATANTTITNTAAETTMLSATALGTLTLPANFLVAGKTIRVRIMGTIVRGAVTNFQFRLYLGGVLVSDSIATSTTNSSGTPTFTVDAMIRCLTTGATGTVTGQLLACWVHNEGTGIFMFGDGATTSATVNTTGTLAINATFTMSGASASNTMTVTNATVEVLG